MLTDWRLFAEAMCERPADFYSGCRKIIRQITHEFDGQALLNKRGRMEDFGFTKSKMTMLTKLYLNEESVDVARKLWDKRVGQGKYGSVGFTFYNHLVKGGMEKRSKRASVMGPCLQSAVVTLLEGGKTWDMDIYYRTTEALKKFPADLVFLRDVVMPRFSPHDTPPIIRCHFANVTVHPMYFATLIPHLPDAIDYLHMLKRQDEKFWTWCVKWTGRYLCSEFGNGIQKFAQAKRTGESAVALIKPSLQTQLQRYIRDHWPGVRHKDGRIDEAEGEDE